MAHRLQAAIVDQLSHGYLEELGAEMADIGQVGLRRDPMRGLRARGPLAAACPGTCVLIMLSFVAMISGQEDAGRKEVGIRFEVQELWCNIFLSKISTFPL